MKKLIMIAILLVSASPAIGLKYSDIGPDFSCCDNSGWVIWEFLDDYCLPTSDEFDPPYGYYPGPATEPPTFGSRHWDNPFNDSGWGCSYGSECWIYADEAYTVPAYAEDSFNQSIPHRGEKLFLRQYFQVVHTMPAGDTEDLGLIGLGLELWDMSVYEENGWTGCPTGYENLAGDGYLGGNEFPSPVTGLSVDHGNGWYTSMWITDFWDTVEATTEYAIEDDIDLDAATHSVCIVGMEIGTPWQIEEVILDFIWFDEPDGSDIPTMSCCCPCPPPPPFEIIMAGPIYEPQDAGGPPPAGPVSDNIQVRLNWKPGKDLDYPAFNCTIVVDPDPSQENVGSADFSFTNPVPPDPNGNVTLTFTQANWDVWQNITVTATQDVLREGNEAFNIDFTCTIDIADCNFGGPGCEPVRRRKGICVVDNDTPYISALPYGALDDVLTENDPCVSKCVDVTLSHQPTDNVEVRAYRESEFDILLESMSVMDPNHLLFTPGNYNIPQQICLEARDDDELAEAWLEWVSGVILLNGFSDDIRYQCADEGGELEEVVVNFNVQDNECGAWGYMRADVNEDCYIDLGDVALIYTQWLICVQPYGDGCDKLWNLFPPQE